MHKDYKSWGEIKEKLHYKAGSALFHEREVWWCALGANIGFEQDGTSALFTRPVLIVKRYGPDTCLVVPLTTKRKKGKYYFSLGMVGRYEAVALLSQIRSIDRKRLANKIATIDRARFESLVTQIAITVLPHQ